MFNFLNFSRRWMSLLLTLGLLLPMGVGAQALPSTPVKVRISTSLGDIEAELHADKAPKTVANFVQYVNDKHYDGLHVSPGGGTFFPRIRPRGRRPGA